MNTLKLLMFLFSALSVIGSEQLKLCINIISNGKICIEIQEAEKESDLLCEKLKAFNNFRILFNIFNSFVLKTRLCKDQRVNWVQMNSDPWQNDWGSSNN